MEFLVRSDTRQPDTMSVEEFGSLRSAERARAIELHDAGVLRRIWRLPGRQSALALYEVRDATELHDVLTSLPLFPHMTVTVEALAQHPMEAQLAQGSPPRSDEAPPG